MALVPAPYASSPHYRIVDVDAAPESLNAEVWRHERQARQLGLSLVVEVHSPSVLASRRLSEWWASGGALAKKVLAGIFLLRVDLKRYGPQAILGLTPYAVAGAPLFVGWNPVGQVLSRSQFTGLTPQAMARPLSRFMRDVRKGRPHSHNPKPSIGSLERTREAAALHRARQGQARTTDSALAPQAAAPTASVKDAFTPDAASLDAHGPPPFDAAALDRLLSAARAGFVELEALLGHQLSFSLEDLRLLDAAVDVLDDEQRITFAREFGAIVAVYVGDTIRAHADADWFIDANDDTAGQRLLLRGQVSGQFHQARPLEWLIETLSEGNCSLYGQALAWCRTH